MHQNSSINGRIGSTWYILEAVSTSCAVEADVGWTDFGYAPIHAGHRRTSGSDTAARIQGRASELPDRLWYLFVAVSSFARCRT